MARRSSKARSDGYVDIRPPKGVETYSVAYFDTETTGVDPATAELIELAVIRVFFDSEGYEVGRFASVRRYQPHNPIPPEASAVHDIIDDDVADRPYFGPEYENDVDDFRLIHNLFDSDLIVAHNLPYDVAILSRYYPEHMKKFEPEGMHVDTLRLAKHFYPGIESHAMKAMRYRFGFDKMAGRRLESHSALDDTKMLEYFMTMVSGTFPLMGPFTKAWWEAMAKQSDQPVMVQIFPFGKHRGELIDNLVQDDLQYIAWCMKQDWLKTEHPDLYHTLLAYSHRKPVELFSHVRRSDKKQG